ncbi:MAG TPA: hypothetical protein VHG51_06475 [Longimicrobiaceae bacterium]|nr:hypothetical protein [Longimicrobiaceae bacterium]
MIGIGRRRRSGPDRFVYAKLALFFLGAGLFFGGVATRRDWAVLVAIGVLVVGVALRFLGGTPEEPGERDEE